jgi:DNA-binding response OmpR family regulator
MRSPEKAASASPARIKVLLVSPDHEDRHCLDRLLNDAGQRPQMYAHWSLVRRSTAEAAMAELRQRLIPIIIWASGTARDGWRKLLTELIHWPDPPLLIVTGHAADGRLWAEALNLGAWDVLAKPFNGEEVHRTLHTAWLHWRHRTAGSSH